MKSQTRNLQSALIVAIALVLSACSGAFDIGTSGEEPVNFNGEEVTNPTKTSEEEAGESILPAPFELSKENPQLLPFHVRMGKLSALTGITQDDPIFDDLKRNRYALGDHNFGQGIGADLTWTATKMSTWVKSLRPICDSAAMHERYPALPEHLNELIIAAYGREAEEADLQLVEDTLAEAPVGDAQYQAVCLAVLTSVEFVGR